MSGYTHICSSCDEPLIGADLEQHIDCDPDCLWPIEDLRELLAKAGIGTAEQTREDIATYLEHVASVRLGSLLNESGRELVSMVANWVRNKLDQQWKSAVTTRTAKEPT